MLINGVSVYKVKLCFSASKKTWTSLPTKELVLKVIKIINTSNNYYFRMKRFESSLLLPPFVATIDTFCPLETLNFNFILISEIIRGEKDAESSRLVGWLAWSWKGHFLLDLLLSWIGLMIVFVLLRLLKTIYVLDLRVFSL